MEPDNLDLKASNTAVDYPSRPSLHLDTSMTDIKYDPCISSAPSPLDDFHADSTLTDITSSESVQALASSGMDSPSSDIGMTFDETALFDGLIVALENPPNQYTSSETDHSNSMSIRDSSHFYERTESRQGNGGERMHDDQVELNVQLHSHAITPIYQYSVPQTPRDYQNYTQTAPSSPHASLPQPDHQNSQKIVSHTRSFSQPPEEITFHRSGHYLGRPLGSRNRISKSSKAQKTDAIRRSIRQPLYHQFAEISTRQHQAVKPELPRSVPEANLLPKLS
jgi:hypothetical protein